MAAGHRRCCARIEGKSFCQLAFSSELPYVLPMTKVQFSLPDTLARDAAKAGLLAPEALEAMVRERLKADAFKSLHALRNAMGEEPITPDMQAEVAQTVRAVRARLRHEKA
jgi:hypothetical protein